MSNGNALDIAIVGMSARLPGAADHHQFWSNLRDKVESIRFLKDEEIAKDFFLLRNPEYVKAVGFLDDYDKFDPDFFDIPRHIAPMMTPEHRLFIEASWAAVEDAGYDVDTISEDVGVYGASNPESIARYKLPPDWISSGQEVIELSYGWCPDSIAPNVLRFLGLTGEALSLATFCTGIHYAIHLASQSLLLGQCDLAIAGGVVVRIPQERGYLWEKGGVFSRDGHCRPYDASGTGSALGSGVASFVLKRLEDAVSARDQIYAVIKGTAVNNNGKSALSYGVAQPDRLAACIRAALEIAEVEPETITQVAGFGVGHTLADAVEVKALEMAFDTKERGYCSLGSVKGNIGNCGVAAGGASLIKAALSLRDGLIPAVINHSEPNREINLPATPFYVSREEAEWSPSCGVRRAGITQIAGAGYNAHIVLEEPPRREPRPQGGPQLVLLSARTPQALSRAKERLVNALDRDPELGLADTAYTLAVGRKSFEHRWAAVVEDRAHLRRALEEGGAMVRLGERLGERGPSAYDRRQLSEGERGLVPAGATSEATLAALRDAWAYGHRIDWVTATEEWSGQRASLPTYPFARERHWLSAGDAF